MPGKGWSVAISEPGAKQPWAVWTPVQPSVIAFEAGAACYTSSGLPSAPSPLSSHRHPGPHHLTQGWSLRDTRDLRAPG